MMGKRDQRRANRRSFTTTVFVAGIIFLLLGASLVVAQELGLQLGTADTATQDLAPIVTEADNEVADGHLGVASNSATPSVRDDDGIAIDVDIDEVDIEEPEPPFREPVCVRHQNGLTFPDSPGSGHQFFIDCLAELRIVQGFTDGLYHPRRDVTRAQLASYVARAVETATQETMSISGPLFPDVARHSTHGGSIYKLRTAGIIAGYTDGTFGPQNSVTRQQTARYVANAIEWVVGPLPTSGARFPDVPVGSQFQADIDKLVTAGVISGYTDGTFRPRDPVTRAQMARFVANSLEALNEYDEYHGP